MSLKNKDFDAAVSLTPGENSRHVMNLAAAYPVLKTLTENRTGWKFWLSWGINYLLKALVKWLRAKGYDMEDPK